MTSNADQFLNSKMDKSQLKQGGYIIGFLLVVATAVAYWEVLDNGFISYDDGHYITENPRVKAGLTLDGIIWAFRTGHSGNWHPLTWLSHMLDCQLFGLNAWGHHLTSLLLHIANTVLLFLVLVRMTEAPWKSAFVAALFALHPMHVESVAWAAERKDVLSTLFWMLTIFAYLRYVEQPRVKRYILVVLSVTLGLMAKPMVVTLPFVLLLLDYWPLGRLKLTRSRDDSEQCSVHQASRRDQESSIARLVREKIPLFGLAAASSVVTFLVQQEGGGVRSLEILPIPTRISNALVAYVTYIEKSLWPTRLAVIYPHPLESLSAEQVGGAALLLLCLSGLVLVMLRQRPYLAVGWLWYIGTLIPVIGIVQVGFQSHADRYTYVPLTGLFIFIAWGVPDLVKRWRARRALLVIPALTLFFPLMVSTRFQVRHWRNSMELFSHAIEVTPNNWVAHSNMGILLAQEGKFAEAIPYHSEALRIEPHSAELYYNLGLALFGQGRINEAIAQYQKALQLKPDYPEVCNSLGLALEKQGKIDEALVCFSDALRIDPNLAEVHNNLGSILARKGRITEATGHYFKALQIKPDYADAHNNMGILLVEQGEEVEAIKHFSEAIRLRHDLAEAHFNLGLTLARQGRLEEAIAAYTEVLRLQPNDKAAMTERNNAIQHLKQSNAQSQRP